MNNTTHARVMVTYSDGGHLLTSDLKPDSADTLARILANGYQSPYGDTARVIRTVSTVDGEVVSEVWTAEEVEEDTARHYDSDTADTARHYDSDTLELVSLCDQAEELGVTLDQLLEEERELYGTVEEWEEWIDS